MEQLKVKQILDYIKYLQSEGMSLKEIMEMPVYIGRDDELNGIHTGWYVQEINPKSKEDEDFIEMINEDRSNLPIKGRSILIS